MEASKLAGMGSTASGRRTSLWDYYDRRAPDYDGGVSGAQRYFSGLGVESDPEVIGAEREQVMRALAKLRPARYLEVGAGPGVFTALLPGSGVALDQSEAALRRLRGSVASVPVLRGDATCLPVATKSVSRVFAGHLYGHLAEIERVAFLTEARRVADELVILDSGRPIGAQAEEWQTRALADGTTFTVYKRHFEIDVLLAGIGGEPLVSGRYFVLVRSTA